MSMFEKATRNKVRFPFKGQCTVEDLWDLPLTDLDTVYKSLNRKRKAEKEDSLLETRSQEDTLLDLQIDIIKHIVEVKREEADKRKQARERKQKREKIMSIMEEKEEDSLRNMSKEDLKKMLEEDDS